MAKKTSYELALEIGGKIQSSLTKSVSGVNNKLDSIGKAAKTAAKIATAAFAAVKIGDFVKDAVDTYSEFNQAMAETAGIARSNRRRIQTASSGGPGDGKTHDEDGHGSRPGIRLYEFGRLERERFNYGVGTGSSLVGSYFDGSSHLFGLGN